MKNIYLDNNATTQVDPRVLEAMLPYFSEYYGNASSMHRFGGNMKHVIDEARGQVAELLGCDASEILFTSGGTESDNAALRGVLDQEPHRRHVIITRVEHPAVRTPARNLQRRGLRLTELAVDSQGRLDLAELEAALDQGPALVSVMWANNETGVIFPIEKIAPMVKAKGAILHCDAVQAAGKIPINLRKTPIDLLSMSGHKLHGPKGIGVLYVRRGTRMEPFMQGGHQEFGRRAGTENVPAIVGLGNACQLARQTMQEENQRVRTLRDRLEQQIVRTCPDARVNGDPAARLPNTTNISFEYVEGEAILLLLDELGIAASSGSACTSGSLEPSHVLRAMGVPFTAVHGSIRFSLSRLTTADEIDYVIEHMPAIIRRLRQISPFSPERDASPAAPYERRPELRFSR
jgi:cysteine desulfurase